MTEKQIEQKLKEEVEKLGGLCWKFVSPGNIGVPDRLVIHEGKVIFVELKASNGKVRPIQSLRLRQLKRRGMKVAVISSYKEIDEFIEKLRR